MLTRYLAGQIFEVVLSSEAPFSGLAKAEKEFLWSIGASLVDILCALTGAQDDITDSIMKQNGIPRFLLVLLTSDHTPEEVLSATLDCLVSMSEENPVFARLIVSDDDGKGLAILHRLVLQSWPQSVMACGILHNVFASMRWHDQNKGLSDASDAILVSPLAKALEAVPSGLSAMTNGELHSSVGTARLALETLADIGTYLLQSIKGGKQRHQEEPEWNGFDDDNDDTEMADAEPEDGGSYSEVEEGHAAEGASDSDHEMSDIEADMEMVTGFDGPEPGSGIDHLPTLRALLQKAVPQLIRISNIRDESAESQTLRDLALSALGNLAWTVSSLDFSDAHNSGVRRAWTPVARRIWSKTISPAISIHTEDFAFARRVASLACAVATSLHGEVPLAAGEHDRFMSLYLVAKAQDPPDAPSVSSPKDEDPFLETGFLCVGVLGRLALPPAPLALNRDIGSFLLSIISSKPRNPPADIVEALGQLFDVYADEDSECDRIFWEDGFLKRLEEAQPKLRDMVKLLDKRRLPELRTRADEAVMNLGRFIQYKRKHAPLGSSNGMDS